MGRVIVLGSLNVDLVVRVARLPTPGSTVAGGDLDRHQGGKGGNQAVAAARVGAEVAFVGAVGEDEFGESALRALAQESVATTHVATVARPTGVALIVVDASGQNLIAGAPGANAAVNERMVRDALTDLRPGPGDVVLASREVPATTVRAALDAARAAGTTTVLNPAPADDLDRDTLRLADFATPNQAELTLICGTTSPTAAAEQLLDTGGTRWLAVTLGAAGAVLVGRGGAAVELPAPAVDAVDTTGAGDAFNGVLAALLAAGHTPADAVAHAVAAASLSTQRPGAREGMPTLEQLNAFVARVRSSR